MRYRRDPNNYVINMHKEIVGLNNFRCLIILLAKLGMTSTKAYICEDIAGRYICGILYE